MVKGGVPPDFTVASPDKTRRAPVRARMRARASKRVRTCARTFLLALFHFSWRRKAGGRSAEHDRGVARRVTDPSL